jgi:hypothetical protein
MPKEDALSARPTPVKIATLVISCVTCDTVVDALVVCATVSDYEF